MSENEKEYLKREEKQIGSQEAEEGYKTAKLIRLGNRELERQLNSKKTRMPR